MSSWRILAASAAALLVSLLVLRTYWRDSAVTATGPSRPAEVADPTNLDAGVATSTVLAKVSGRDQLRVRIRVVDDRTSVALPGATGTWIKKTSGSATLAASPSGLCDDNGVLEVEPVADRNLLIRHAAYVPQFVDASIGEREVKMQPSAVLQVAVIDQAGRPVPGATCILTSKPASEFATLGRQIGIGHPLATRPIWMQTTDPLGGVSFDELPPGRFHLNVLDRSRVPADESGANGLFDLPVGVTRTTVTMEDMHGAVFMCPSSSPVASVNWHVSMRRVRIEPRVVQRLGLVRGGLAERFPGALIFVHQPNQVGGEPVPVELSVTLADETHWTGKWQLTPIRELEAPMYLELYEGPSRAVVVRIVDPSGREYRGIPVSLYCRERGMGYRCESGERIAIRHGKYHLNPTQADPVLSQALAQKTMVVSEESTDELVVRIEEPVSPVEITVHYPNDQVLGPSELYLEDERGQGPAIVNYVPDMGAIRRWLTGKSVAIRLRSVAYQDIHHPATEIHPDRITKIDLHVVEK